MGAILVACFMEFGVRLTARIACGNRRKPGGLLRRVRFSPVGEDCLAAMGAILVACFMEFGVRLTARIACGNRRKPGGLLRRVRFSPVGEDCLRQGFAGSARTRKGHCPLTRIGIITFLSFGADEKISHALIFSSHGRRGQSNGFFRGKPWLLGYLPGVCERFFTATSVRSP